MIRRFDPEEPRCPECDRRCRNAQGVTDCVNRHQKEREMTYQSWPEVWGIIPTFIDPADRRTAKAQIAENYVGGWSPFKGFRFDPNENSLTYPEDEPMFPIDARMFRDELLMIYDSAWVVILEKDGKWEVSRLD